MERRTPSFRNKNLSDPRWVCMLACLIWHGYELSAEVKRFALHKCVGLYGHFLGIPDPLLTPETLIHWQSGSHPGWVWQFQTKLNGLTIVLHGNTQRPWNMTTQNSAHLPGPGAYDVYNVSTKGWNRRIMSLRSPLAPQQDCWKKISKQDKHVHRCF